MSTGGDWSAGAENAVTRPVGRKTEEKKFLMVQIKGKEKLIGRIKVWKGKQSVFTCWRD